MSNNDETKFFDELNNSSIDISLEGEFLDESRSLFMVIARGYIDAFNSREFGSAIEKTIEVVQPKKVILNLESVNYVASMGFGQLVSLLKIMKSKGVEIILYNINAKVYEVLSLLGFSNFFRIIDDLSQIDKKEKSIFPKSLTCPHCGVSLKVPKSGKFVCKGCKSPIRVDNEGRVIDED
jgi:anti-anti-sigma factor